MLADMKRVDGCSSNVQDAATWLLYLFCLNLLAVDSERLV
jgi:hypothetical protein